MSGGGDDYQLDYKRRNRAIPHETTRDQFFDEDQLEACRALGFHIVKGLFTRKTPFTGSHVHRNGGHGAVARRKR